MFIAAYYQTILNNHKSITKLMRRSYLFSLKLSLQTSENTMLNITGTDFILVDYKNAFGVAKFDRAAIQNIAVFVRLPKYVTGCVMHIAYELCACTDTLLSTGYRAE